MSSNLIYNYIMIYTESKGINTGHNPSYTRIKKG